MTIGDRIKAIRANLSRDKFAPQTGISKTALVNYETGERTPPSDYLVKLLELFPKISPAWLLMGEGEMERGEGINVEQVEKFGDFKKILLCILEALEVAEKMNFCTVSSLTPRQRTALIYAMLIQAEFNKTSGDVLKRQLLTNVPIVLAVTKQYKEMSESEGIHDLAETLLGKLLNAVQFVIQEGEKSGLSANSITDVDSE